MNRCLTIKERTTFKFIIALVLVVILAFSLAGCGQGTQQVEQKEEVKVPDEIVIGYSLALSGPNAGGAAMTMLPNFKLWQQEVNAAGGIYLKKYDKRVPVRYIEYDDRSDIDTTLRNIEKLVLEDKVDLVFGPWGTAFNFAAAPLLTKYEMPWVATTFGSTRIRQVADQIPYFFAILNQPDNVATGLVDFLDAQLKAGKIGNKVALIYVGDAFGIEHASVATPLLPLKGFELVHYEGYPLGTKDFSLLINQIKAKKPDVFIAFSYPGDTMLLTEQSIVAQFNPSIFSLAVGSAWGTYRNRFGADVIEGVIGPGAWSPEMPHPGAKEYYEKINKFTNGANDYWGLAYQYASLQILQEAIETVGSIDSSADRKAIRDLIATKEFSTVIGPVKFERQANTKWPGNLGQWQSGKFQSIGINPTAEAIVPKPAWPKK